MKPIGFLLFLGLSLVIPPPTVAERSPQSDVAALVAAARQALGGEAALGAVASFTVTGTFRRNVGPTPTSTSFETSCVLPDRFLRVSRRSVGGPMSFEIVDYEGFNADTSIRDTVAPDAPFPVTIPLPPPVTPEEAAERLARQLNSQRKNFLETVIPLFLVVPPAYGLELSTGGKVAIAGGQADAIIMKRADGAAWQLLLSETTRLPVQLTWRAKPIVTFSTSTVTSSRGGLPPPPVTLPAGDPTEGLPDVAWVMTIRDYKVADGLNWPRRLTTTVDGKAWQDLRVSKYRVNPKIDPKIFEPRK